MGIVETLLIGTGFLAIILIVLLFVWAIKPAKPNKEIRGEVKDNLKKIKEQINGDK